MNMVSTSIRPKIFLAILISALALCVTPAMSFAQDTPFDSQYGPPPTTPPPTSPPPETTPPDECVPPGEPGTPSEPGSPDEPGATSGSGSSSEECVEGIQFLPATGGPSSIPFAAIAPAALLGAGIIVTTGIVVARRRS